MKQATKEWKRRVRLWKRWGGIILAAVVGPGTGLALAAGSPPPQAATTPPAAAPAEKPSPISADRPGFTNATDTVPQGRIQVEAGYTYTRTGQDEDHSLGQLLLRVPVLQSLEVRAGIPSYEWARGPGGNTSGFQDLSLGLKAKLLQGSEKFNFWRPSIAFIGSTTVPTGSPAYRENHLQPQAQFEFSWNLTQKINLGASLNDIYASNGGQQFNEFAYSGALTYSFTDRLSSFIEFYSFVPGNPGGPNANFLDSGIVLLANNNTQLDINGGIGLNGQNPDFFIGAGIARRW